MNYLFRFGLLSGLLVPSLLYGQELDGPVGIRWKGVEILPEATVAAAYDDRIQFDGAGNASSDYYSELSAGVTLRNLSARYRLSAKALYGYRFYSENKTLNDDFYNLGASVGSDETPLRWSLSTDLAKTLGYNAAYDPATGDGPDSILSDQPNLRTVAQGSVAYAVSISDKAVLVPGYSLQHYYQEFEGGDTAEWQIHSASIEMNYAYSPKTTFLVGGYYDTQVNADEDGNIVAINVGIERNLSDKTSLRALIGYGYADYDLSGSSQGVLSDIRAQWQATDKVSTYVFYGNNYQPGYGGAPARMLYRAGYGVGWLLLTKWSLGAHVLHSYEDPLGNKGDDAVYGGVRHFFTAQCRYAMTDKLSLSCVGNYVNDEEPMNKTVIAIRVSYAY